MKKRLFLIALCVCLAAAVACGSLAYFTSEDKAVNKFMTAAYDPENPNPKADDIFSVEVTEDATKDPADTHSVGSTKKNENGGYDYEKLLPGSNAAKKVNVKNTGKYDQYVRVKITVSKANEWKAFFGSAANLAEKLCNIDTANWQLAKTTVNDDDSITYTYNYAKAGVGTVLKPGTSIAKPVFTKVMIPAEDFDAEDFVKVDGFTVSVIAEAIQADYTGTISQAFEKFEAQNK